MSAEPVPITKALELRWQAFSEAAQLAQKTMRIEDGIAAGKAWRRWLEAFERRADIRS